MTPYTDGQGLFPCSLPCDYHPRAVHFAALRRAAVASDPPRYDPEALTGQLAAIVMIERRCPEAWSPRLEGLSLPIPAPPFSAPAG